jgi:hypothetical protein
VWAEHEGVKMHNVRFTDETQFHLDGRVNKQNVQFWAPGNPHIFTKKTHHTPKITVWVAISRKGLMEQVFFHQTEQ